MNHKLNYNHTVYACYLGYITQAVINNLAPLLFLIFQKEFSLSLSQITMITSLNFALQLIIDYLSAKFVDKIGYRKCLVFAHIFSVTGLWGLSIFPHVIPSSFAGIILAVLFYAVGGGLIEVLVSPVVESCPSENKASAMALLHSFYCWGTVAVVFLSTMFLFAFGKEKWYFLPFIWSLIPLFNTFFFAKVPIQTLTEENQGMSVKELFKNKLFWIFVLLMICSGASEQAMSQWSSTFAEKSLSVSKVIGDLTGPCLFSVFMGISRLIYGKAGHKLNLLKFISFSSVLCIAAYLLASLTKNAVFGLIGCTLCGFSVGIMWPGVFSTASGKMKNGGTALFALLALAGDVGCSAGPFLVGMVSSASNQNLKTGLLAAVVFPVIILITIIFNKNKLKWESKS